MHLLNAISNNISVLYLQPKESVITRWRADPWARGSYSFVAVGASGSDYDVLATPVAPRADAAEESKLSEEELAKSKKVPRLYFAGVLAEI